MSLHVDELGEPGAWLTEPQRRALHALADADVRLPAGAITSPTTLHYKSAAALTRFLLIEGRYDSDARQVLYGLTAAGVELEEAIDRFYNR